MISGLFFIYTYICMYRNIHTKQLKVYALYIYVHTCVYTYICVCVSMHVCVHVRMFLYCDIHYVHPLFVLLHFTYPTFPHHSSPPLSLLRHLLSLQFEKRHGHHWVEGNLPNDAKCCVCHKSCSTSECLASQKCGWCGRMVRGSAYNMEET